MNIDPEKAGEHYRQRALDPLRGTVPDADLKRMEESMSGACTMEVAAFDEFAGLFSEEGDVESGGFTKGYVLLAQPQGLQRGTALASSGA